MYLKQMPLMDKIVEFLCRAKKATYAAAGAEVAPSRPASHDLAYVEEPLRYIDTYLGGEKFAGEEAVWQDNVPVWAMNYVGRVVAEGFSGDFLKEALLLVPKEMPFRGPAEYCNGQYKYQCAVTGDFEWFSGEEEIYFNGIKVYECMFHGGLIQ